MGEKIFIVTGAAGHLGAYVVRDLLARGDKVRALVLPHESCPDFIEMNRHLLTQYVGDVRDGASLDPLFEGEGPLEFIVIHCAGIVSISKKADQRVYDVNVGGTKNVIDACLRHGAKRLVYVSSVHAIPSLAHGQVIREIDSFSPDRVRGYYDKTKAIATHLVLQAAKSGLDAVVLHPSGIIGPNALPTGNMAQSILAYLKGSLPAAVRGGFDFVDVRDVAAGIVAAADKGQGGETYILSNRFVDLRELFDTLSDVGGRKKLKLYLPMRIAKMAAPFAELYAKIAKKTPFFTGYSMNTLSENAIFSHDKASRELGYRTRALRETLADTATWIKGKITRKKNRRAKI